MLKISLYFTAQLPALQRVLGRFLCFLTFYLSSLDPVFHGLMLGEGCKAPLENLSELSCSALSLQPPVSLHLMRAQYTLRIYLSAVFPCTSHSYTVAVHTTKVPWERIYGYVWSCFVTGIFRNLNTHCHLHIAIKSSLKIWLFLLTPIYWKLLPPQPQG